MNLKKSYVLTIGWLAAIGIFAIIVHVVNFSLASSLLRNLLGSLHAPGFGVIAVSFMFVFRTWNRPARSYLLAAGLALALGVLTELLQFIGPRDADPVDLFHDALGIAGFLGVVALFDAALRTEVPKLSSLFVKVIACIVFSLAVIPTAWYAYATVAQYFAFPVILTFDSSWERSTYRAPWRMQFDLAPQPEYWPLQGGKLAKLTFSETRSAGFEIAPFPAWSDYSSVSFLAASGNQRPVEVSIIVRDKNFKRRDRNQFTGSLLVGPTPQRYSIPLADIQRGTGNQTLDLAAITSLTIALANATDGDFVLVDDFRLE